MRIKHTILFILLALCFLMTECGVAKNKNGSPFILKEACYQSQIINKEATSTEITVYLNNVRPGVEFDSLIFRGVRFPVFVVENNSGIVLRGILSSGVSVLTVETEYVGKPDQLIYTFKGAKRSYLLKNIQRKETKYNK